MIKNKLLGVLGLTMLVVPIHVNASNSTLNYEQLTKNEKNFGLTFFSYTQNYDLEYSLGGYTDDGSQEARSSLLGLRFAYGVSDHLTLEAGIPVSQSSDSSGDLGSSNRSGTGDIRVSARFKLSDSISNYPVLFAGIKLATADDGSKSIGTGATDMTFGGAYVYDEQNARSEFVASYTIRGHKESYVSGGNYLVLAGKSVSKGDNLRFVMDFNAFFGSPIVYDSGTEISELSYILGLGGNMILDKGLEVEAMFNIGFGGIYASDLIYYGDTLVTKFPSFGTGFTLNLAKSF